MKNAVIWAEINQTVVKLLNTELNSLMQVTVITLKFLLIQKYLIKVIEILTVNFNSEIADLCQLNKKILLVYYKQTLNLLNRVDKQNQLKKITNQISELFLLKTVMLNTVLRAFIWDIQNEDIWWDVFREFIITDWSLISIYILMKKSRRVKYEYIYL